MCFYDGGGEIQQKGILLQSVCMGYLRRDADWRADAPLDLKCITGELQVRVGRGRHVVRLRGVAGDGPKVSVSVAVSPWGGAVCSSEVPATGGEPVWDAALTPVDVIDGNVQVRTKECVLLHGRYSMSDNR